MKKLLGGFKDFIMRGNVLDLAVGFVMGAAFTTMVKALVSDLLTPLVAAIFKQPDFSNLTFTINHSQFLYGDFINAVIAFFLVAVAVYFFVVAPMSKFLAKLKRPVEAPQTAKSDELIVLEEIRDALKGKKS